MVPQCIRTSRSSRICKDTFPEDTMRQLHRKAQCMDLPWLCTTDQLRRSLTSRRHTYTIRYTLHRLPTWYIQDM